MNIPDTFTPLLLSSVRDSVLYVEGLLRSETIKDKSEYEDYHLQLTQFLAFLKSEYSKIEKEVGLPLADIIKENR